MPDTSIMWVWLYCYEAYDVAIVDAGYKPQFKFSLYFLKTDSSFQCIAFIANYYEV